MTKRITLQRVAKECGVTAAAVSYALRGSKEVSEELRERIISKANELGYVPSSAARSLRGVVPRRIGIVLPLPGSPTHSRNLEAIELACAAHSIETTVHYHYWHVETEKKILQSLLDSGISGLVLHPAGRETSQTLSSLALAGLHVPFVAFGGIDASPETAPYHRGNYSPHPDDLANLCLNEVIERGHRRIAFLFQGPLQPEGGLIQTLRKFQETAAIQKDLEIEFFYLDDSSSAIRQKVLNGLPCQMADFIETDAALARHFLDHPFDATVAITQDDLTALSLLSDCAKRGMEVPTDLSVMSIGGSYVCNLGVLPIAHLAVQIDEIARDMLARLTSGGSADYTESAYPMKYVDGESLGKVKVMARPQDSTIKLPKGRQAAEVHPEEVALE